MSKQNETTKIELPRAVVQLHRFVGKSGVNSSGTLCVHIDADPDDKTTRLAAMATQGHHMCVVTWPRPDGVPGLPVRIPGEVLKAAAYGSVMATSWELSVLDPDYGGGERTISIDVIAPTRGLHATEPNSGVKWQDIYQTSVRESGAEPVGAIQLDMRLVSTLAGYLKACRIRRSACRLQIPGEELDPLRVDIEHDAQRISYIVMPCRAREES